MLAAQAQQREIDGVTYEVLPLASGMSLKVLARVLRMAAPGFESVASLREAAGSLGAMLAGGLSGLDEDVLAFVCSELAKVTRAHVGEGKVLQLSTVFETHFQGRIVALFAWLRFAAEVTYGPLGELLKAQLDAPPAARA